MMKRSDEVRALTEVVSDSAERYDDILGDSDSGFIFMSMVDDDSEKATVSVIMSPNFENVLSAIVVSDRELALHIVAVLMRKIIDNIKKETNERPNQSK